MTAPDTFRVVFVCTGNRFRSPLAAAILGHATGGLPVSVESAGTLELDPTPALPGAVDAAAQLGLDLSAHRSRPLSTMRLADADLVIGFERLHMATAVVDRNAHRDRTFTLPELLTLLERVQPATDQQGPVRARALIRAAAALRPPGLLVPEIEDPIGRSTNVVTAIADEVRTSTERLAAQLFRR